MERFCRCPKCGFLVERQGTTPVDARANQAIAVDRHLVRRERLLLAFMLRRFGRVVTHDDLIITLWPDGSEPDEVLRTLRVRISHIRGAIKAAGVPWAIRSEFGTGYRLYEVDPSRKETSK